jgi:hypothetical protein
MEPNVTSFNITGAKAFLQKAHDEQKDFVASNCLSARHKKGLTE